MELANEQVDRRRKRTIQIVFIVFIGLLLLLTFFGNTLQSLTLPKVRTEPLVAGSLIFAFEGRGMLKPFTEAQLTNPAGWKVQKILAKEDERVKKGQKLIEYDSKTAERELDNEIANLKKMNIELQNLQDQFIQSSREEDKLDIRSASRAIETLKLDLDTQERIIDELRDRLASGRELKAPFDGIVTTLNAVEGLASGEPDVVITNDSHGYRVDIPADFALLTRLEIALGSKVEVEVEVQNVQEQQTRILEGTIVEIADAEPRDEPFESGDEGGQTRTIAQKVVRIKVEDPELKGGEQAWINIEKRSRQEGLVVSNEAIHQERDGMFVYKVDEQRGALGNVFVVSKVPVQPTERNDHETLIQSDSLYEGDLLILESSEPLQDGERIRLQ